MKTKEAAQEAEERVRKLVRELSGEKRLLFFQKAEKDLKDPDTYAALNALFVAQIVVQDYNNAVMERIYREVIKD